MDRLGKHPPPGSLSPWERDGVRGLSAQIHPIQGCALAGRRVCIVGMGRSAVAAARLLCAKGARPFVSEAEDGARFDTYRAALDALGVSHECGGHSTAAFDTELIVLSPGVPPAIAPVAQARACGVPVLSELELASWCCTSRMLAVTGTNGKTTTTELLRAMLGACGVSVGLAGNNDTPLSQAVLASPQPDYLVVEVSSYALESSASFHPWIGAMLNLTPDHLGRHGTLEEYADVKARLFQRQGAGDVAVVNADDPWAAKMAVPEQAQRQEFSLCRPVEVGLWVDGDVIRAGDAQVARCDDVRIPGRHNLANALAALAVLRAGGFAWDAALAGLRAFRGVEHRIELVADLDGVAYYNDSKSTNVDSLRVALESFPGRILLLAGGRGKGGGYESLREIVAERVKRLIAFGEDAPRFEADLAAHVPFERVAVLAEAVARAHALAIPGDVVLLSPGCASFDQYPNFEVRGADFKACVRRLTAGELA